MRLVEFPSLFIGAGQQDLGAGTHADHLVGQVQAFVHQTVGLLHNLRVDAGQVAAVEAHIVLHQEDALHAHHGGVLGHIQVVLHQLHNGQEDAEIPLPHEDMVDERRVRPGQHGLQVAHIVGQQDDGHPHTGGAQTAHQLQHMHVAHIHGKQHHVNRMAALQQLQRLAGPAHPRKLGGMHQVQVGELAGEQILQLAILGQQEGVVHAGHQEDFPHPMLDQLLETGNVVETVAAHAIPANLCLALPAVSHPAQLSVSPLWLAGELQAIAVPVHHSAHGEIGAELGVGHYQRQARRCKGGGASLDALQAETGANLGGQGLHLSMIEALAPLFQVKNGATALEHQAGRHLAHILEAKVLLVEFPCALKVADIDGYEVQLVNLDSGHFSSHSTDIRASLVHVPRIPA